jgi:hypothetical protein
MTVPRLTKQQIAGALEKAAEQRRQRVAAGEWEPLDERPVGPPVGDEAAMERFGEALRLWYEKHVGRADD